MTGAREDPHDFAREVAGPYFDAVDAHVAEVGDDEIEASYAEFVALIDTARPHHPKESDR